MDDMMLIVDDVEMNREILKVLFDKKYEIMEAENGEEALEILERCQGSIDIVLLDLLMKGLSGFEVLERRREMEYFKNVPVVVITSSGQMEDQIKAFDLGANDFIVKPFVPEIVISRVNNVMSSNRRMLSIELEAQKLKIKSELDEMTGLYNKMTTENMMDTILNMSENRQQVMMIIDIDNFKTVNDTSGHQAGDHVIKIIADLISGHFRKTDIVGRIGGDEFCVMMVDVPSLDIALEKVNELIQIMRYKPNLTIPEYVTLSIGLTTNEKKTTNYKKMFKEADEALYLAKQAGKAQFCQYGVEQIQITNDERPVIILLSNNRGVCSTIHALIPSTIRIVEVLQVEDLERLTETDLNRTELVYVDVSTQTESSENVWARLKQLNLFSMDQVIAICKEGETTQYMEALNYKVADMLTTPIDVEAFKRRMKNFLEKRMVE